MRHCDTFGPCFARNADRAEAFFDSIDGRSSAALGPAHGDAHAATDEEIAEAIADWCQRPGQQRRPARR